MKRRITEEQIIPLSHKSCEKGLLLSAGADKELWSMELSSLPVSLATDLKVDWEEESKKLLKQAKDMPDL